MESPSKMMRVQSLRASRPSKPKQPLPPKAASCTWLSLDELLLSVLFPYYVSSLGILGMARQRRQLVMMGASIGGTTVPLGDLSAVMASLLNFNTGTDGTGDKGTGIRLLHGPGYVVELPTSLDPVGQALVTINDEDIALAVLFRICKKMSWRMMDMESGRSFG